MPASTINFFTQSVALSLKKRRILRKCLIDLINKENNALNFGEVSVIFCDDSYLHDLNRRYLKHSTLTDIITFDYRVGNLLSGDIFISVERVKENAKKYSQPYKRELTRVIIHGFLHLCGQNDKTKEERKVMTQKENFYLDGLKRMISQANEENY